MSYRKPRFNVSFGDARQVSQQGLADALAAPRGQHEQILQVAVAPRRPRRRVEDRVREPDEAAAHAEALGFWFPEDGKGTIGNDNVAIAYGMGMIVAIDEDGIPLWRCSASLLSSTVVLTAGHCVEEPADRIEAWFDEGPIATDPDYLAALATDPDCDRIGCAAPVSHWPRYGTRK
jgi:hypothetical protein